MIVTHPLKNSRIPRLPCVSVHAETVADHLPRKRLLTGFTSLSNCGEKYPVGVGRSLMLAPRAVPKRRGQGSLTVGFWSGISRRTLVGLAARLSWSSSAGKRRGGCIADTWRTLRLGASGALVPINIARAIFPMPEVLAASNAPPTMPPASGITFPQINEAFLSKFGDEAKPPPFD